MSCTLRAGGADFDVNAFLANSSLKPCAVFRRGEPKCPASKPNGPIHQDSCFNVGVSEAEFGDLLRQTQDALLFLEANEDELIRLVGYPGVEGVEFDFAVKNEDAFVQSYCFAPDLIAWIGRLGIELCVSCYVKSEEEVHPTTA